MASISINGMSKIRIEHGPVTPTPRVERRYSTDGIASSTEKKDDANAQDYVGLNRTDMMSRLAQEDDYEIIQSDRDGDVLSVTKDGAEQIPERSWFIAKAQIEVRKHKFYKGKGPVLYPISIEPAEKPEDELVYFS